jgi:hypothetical protein
MPPVDLFRLLHRLEWARYPDGSACPCCCGLRPQHRQGCDLAAALASLSSLALWPTGTPATCATAGATSSTAGSPTSPQAPSQAR